MKIKISKNNWKMIGKKSGWIKKYTGYNFSSVKSSNIKSYLKIAQANLWHEDVHPEITNSFYNDEKENKAQHPLREHFPLLAQISSQVIEEGKKITGTVPNTSDAMGVAYYIVRLETKYSDVLSSMAIDCVQNHLDFSEIEEMIEWDVQIGSPESNPSAGSNIQGRMSEDKESTESGTNVNAKKKLDDGIHRVKTKMMMQLGSAMSIYKKCGIWAQEYMPSLPLDLKRAYKKLGILNQSSYFTEDWISKVSGASGGSGSEVGSSVLVRNDATGKIVIKVRAMCFPMLVYECARGLLEVVSHTYNKDRYSPTDQKTINDLTHSHIAEVDAWHTGTALVEKIEKFLELMYPKTTYFQFYQWFHTQTDSKKLHQLLSLIIEENFEGAKKLVNDDKFSFES